MEAGVVTRVRKHGVELTPELEFGLMLGPGPLSVDLDAEDLAVGWRIHGAEIMAGWQRQHGSRPWGWWVFEKGEEPPPREPGANEIRLAELGELTEEECAALAKRAAEARAQLETGVKYSSPPAPVAASTSSSKRSIAGSESRKRSGIPTGPNGEG